MPDMNIATTATLKGKAKRKLSCELIVVNKKTASHLLKSALFPRQRDVSPMQVGRYANEMRRGYWIPGSPLYFAVLPNGDMFLLNGQHSLNAVMESGIAQPFVATYCGVQDIEEAGHIYSRFDIHRRRTWHDAYKAAGFDEKFSINSVWVGAFGSAIRMLLSHFNPDNKQYADVLYSRETQLRIFESYIQYAESYTACIAHTNGQRAAPWRRSSVMSVALECMRYQPKKAAEFFGEASLDDGLRKTDPRKKLLEYLTYAGAHSNEERRLTAHATALAWNAFYQGDDLTVMQPAKQAEIKIAGTPWKGKDYQPFADIVSQFLAPADVTPVSYELFTTGELTTARGERIPITQALR